MRIEKQLADALQINAMLQQALEDIAFGKNNTESPEEIASQTLSALAVANEQQARDRRFSVHTISGSSNYYFPIWAQDEKHVLRIVMARIAADSRQRTLNGLPESNESIVSITE